MTFVKGWSGNPADRPLGTTTKKITQELRAHFPNPLVILPLLVFVMGLEFVHAQVTKVPTKADLIKFDRERNFERLPRSMLTKEGDLIENLDFQLGVMKLPKNRSLKSESLKDSWAHEGRWYENWEFNCAYNNSITPFTECSLTRKLIFCAIAGLKVEKFEHDALSEHPSLFIDNFDAKNKIITLRYRTFFNRGPWLVVKATIEPFFIREFSTSSFPDKDEKKSEFEEYDYISQEGLFPLEMPCEIQAWGLTPRDGTAPPGNSQQ